MTRLLLPGRIVSLLVPLVAMAFIAGCNKREAASIATPAEAQAAIQQAFKQAKPEFKTAADEAAAAIQNEPAKALFQLQALSSNPDLDPQQRNAAQDSILVIAAKLRAAAAQGDAEAEKAMEAYRATR
ncbi:MAG: hypothetical protein HY043_05055 [Verrucomicrobia bacterium]|nr:hypothetical protein [Verrucomicrobiota bacterium]